MRPARILNIIEEMYWALCEVEDYFEQRQDADSSEGKYRPNEEMRLLMIVNNAIKAAEGKI